HLLHLMPRALMRDLGLESQGLKLAADGLPTVALSPDGGHLVFGAGNVSGLTERSSADAAAYAEWQALLGRLSGALHPVLAAAPPRLGSEAWRDCAALLGLGWRLRRPGRRRRQPRPRSAAQSRQASLPSRGLAACACTICSRTASAWRSSRVRWR